MWKISHVEYMIYDVDRNWKSTFTQVVPTAKGVKTIIQSDIYMTTEMWHFELDSCKHDVTCQNQERIAKQ